MITEEDKPIIEILRKKWSLPESVSDDDIKDAAKDSLTWASVALSIALNNLGSAIKGEFLNLISKVKS